MVAPVSATTKPFALVCEMMNAIEVVWLEEEKKEEKCIASP